MGSQHCFSHAMRMMERTGMRLYARRARYEFAGVLMVATQ